MSRNLIRFIAFMALAVHVSMPLAMGRAQAEVATPAIQDCEQLQAEKHAAPAQPDQPVNPANPGNPGKGNHNMPPCCGVCSLTPSCVNPAVATAFKPQTIANIGVRLVVLAGDTGRITSREQHPPRAPPFV